MNMKGFHIYIDKIEITTRAETFCGGNFECYAHGYSGDWLVFVVTLNERESHKLFKNRIRYIDRDRVLLFNNNMIDKAINQANDEHFKFTWRLRD